MRLQRVSALPLRRVTDAETSSDDATVAIRTNDAVVFYRTADLTSAKPRGITVSLRALKEPQGEGVAVDADGLVLSDRGRVACGQLECAALHVAEVRRPVKGRPTFVRLPAIQQGAPQPGPRLP
jgi:hypothetical protein